MLLEAVFLLFFFEGFTNACVKVKPKDNSFPCKRCKPAYNDTCSGVDMNNLDSCATAKQAKVQYQIAYVPFIGMNACTIKLKCPPETITRFPFERIEPNAYCIDEENEARLPVDGKWLSGQSWLARFEATGWEPIACRPYKAYTG